MKKLLSLLLVAMLLLSILAACGNESAPADDTTGSTEALEDSVFGENSTQAPQRGTDPVTGNSDQIYVQPTQNQENQGSTQPTEGETTVPTSPATGETTTPTSPTTGETTETITMDYETFISLSKADRKKFQESFSDIDAFFTWYNAARDAYKAANPSVETDGSVNLDEIAGNR